MEEVDSLVRHRQRWRWVLAGVLLLLVGASEVILPQLLRAAAERLASRALSAPVRVGSVQIDWLGSGVHLANVRLFASEADPQPFAAWASLDLDLAPWELKQGHLHIERLDIRDVTLSLVEENGGARRFARPSAADSGSKPAFLTRITVDRMQLVDMHARIPGAWVGADQVAPVAIGKLAVDDGSYAVAADGEVAWAAQRLRLTDGTLRLSGLPREGEGLESEPSELTLTGARGRHPASATTTWSVERVELAASPVSLVSRGGDRTALVVRSHAEQLGTNSFPVRIAVEGVGALVAEGQLDLAPLAFEGRLSAASVDLARLVRLVAGEESRLIGSGLVTGDLDARFAWPEGPAADDPPLLRARGTLDLVGVDAFDPDADGVAASWDRLRSELEALRVEWDTATEEAHFDVHLSRAEVFEPSLLVVRSPSDDDVPAGAEAPTAHPLHVLVDELTVHRSHLSLADRSFESPVVTEVGDVELVARGVRFPELRADSIELHAPRLGREALRLNGHLADASGAFALHAERVHLAPYEPYLRLWLGRSVSGGELSVDASLEMQGDRYRAPVRLLVHDLLLGERARDVPSFKERFGISLPLALALLRDRNGVVALSLSMEGDARGLRIRPLPMLGQAFRKALLTALTAPLRLVGRVALEAGKIVRVDPRSLHFEPGRVELTARSAKRLEKLSRLLAEHPELGVVLRSAVSDRDVRWLEEDLRGVGGSDRALETARELPGLRIALVREHLQNLGAGSEARVRLTEPSHVSEDAPPHVTVELEPVAVAAPPPPEANLPVS